MTPSTTTTNPVTGDRSPDFAVRFQERIQELSRMGDPRLMRPIEFNEAAKRITIAVMSQILVELAELQRDAAIAKDHDAVRRGGAALFNFGGELRQMAELYPSREKTLPGWAGGKMQRWVVAQIEAGKSWEFLDEAAALLQVAETKAA